MFKPLKTNTVSFLVLLLVVFCGCLKVNGQNNQATGQAPQAKDSLWNILSPARNSAVKDHELLIAIRLGRGEKFKISSVVVTLDDYIVNFRAKITENKVTLLYLDHLPQGKHFIKVEGKTIDGGILPAYHWSFTIVSPTGITDSSSAPVAKAITTPQNTFKLNGTVAATSRNEEITGPGAESERPEPRSLQDLNINLLGKYNTFSFPVNIYLTNTETPQDQPRDRFMVGFKSTHIEAYIGDVFPNFDELALNGTRVRGAQLSLISGRAKLQVVYGDLTRPIEGVPYRFPNSQGTTEAGYSPADSIVGVYRRTLSAARLSLGKIEEGQTFGLTYVKCTDAINSIQYGESPSQNVVIGADQQIITQNKVASLSSEISMSMTTTDLTKPVSSAEHIDSVYGTNIPINPPNYAWLIKINPSTTPLAFQYLSSLSGYVRGTLKLGFNNFTAEYRSIGPAYQSFGDPYLVNDMRTITAGDNMVFWKHKISTVLKAIRQNDNLRQQSASTLVTYIYIANLSININKHVPTIFGGFRQYKQTTSIMSDSLVKEAALGYLNSFTMTTYINGGLSYDLKTGSVHNLISLSYNNSTNSSNLGVSENSNTQGVSGSFGQNFAFPFSYRFDYSHYYIVTNGSITLSDINTYGGSITYKVKKDVASFTLGYTQSLDMATIFSGQTVMDYMSLIYSQKFTKNFTAKVEVGYSFYNDYENPTINNYDDKFINIALNYLIDVK